MVCFFAGGAAGSGLGAFGWGLWGWPGACGAGVLLLGLGLAGYVLTYQIFPPRLVVEFFPEWSERRVNSSSLPSRRSTSASLMPTVTLAPLARTLRFSCHHPGSGPKSAAPAPYEAADRAAPASS